MINCARGSRKRQSRDCANGCLERTEAIRKLIAKANQQTSFSPEAALQNYAWREKVAQWCYDIADYLEIAREIVYTAIHILDRHLALNHQNGHINKTSYEAASISSLYLAIRISGAANIAVPDLLRMCRSSLSVRDVVSTGKRILGCLCFDDEVVTPAALIRSFIGILEHYVDFETIMSLFDLSSYLVEISVCEPKFSSISAAKIALAAMVVSLEQTKTTMRSAHPFIRVLEEETQIDVESQEFQSVRALLLSSYRQSHGNCPGAEAGTVISFLECENASTTNTSMETGVLIWEEGSDLSGSQPALSYPERPMKRARSL